MPSARPGCPAGVADGGGVEKAAHVATAAPPRSVRSVPAVPHMAGLCRRRGGRQPAQPGGGGHHAVRGRPTPLRVTACAQRGWLAPARAGRRSRCGTWTRWTSRSRCWRARAPPCAIRSQRRLSSPPPRGTPQTLGGVEGGREDDERVEALSRAAAKQASKRGKKAAREQQPALTDGSHEDAVLGLSWNGAPARSQPAPRAARRRSPASACTLRVVRCRSGVPQRASERLRGHDREGMRDATRHRLDEP